MLLKGERERVKPHHTNRCSNAPTKIKVDRSTIFFMSSFMLPNVTLLLWEKNPDCSHYTPSRYETRKVKP